MNDTSGSTGTTRGRVTRSSSKNKRVHQQIHFIVMALLGVLALLVVFVSYMVRWFSPAEEPVMCTLIAGESVVSVRIPSSELGPDPQTSLQITIDGQQRNVSPDTSGVYAQDGEIVYRWPVPENLDGGEPFSITVSYVDNQATTRTLTYDGTLEIYFPNGEQCPPRLVGAAIDLVDGKLVTVQTPTP